MQKKQKLTDRKRQAILDAAVAEFQEKGFLSTRTSEIARRAKVSSRTLYNHFESKELLFEAILDIIFTDAVTVAAVGYDRNVPFRDQLISVVDNYLDAITDDQMISLLRMTLAEFLRDTELAKRAMVQMFAHDDPVKALIKQGMKEGELRKADPDIAAQQITAMVKAFFHAPLVYLGESLPFSESRKVIITDCVDMFLTHYRCH